MITFLTLFLNLITGAQPVELQVQEPVATVEIYLDGQSTGVVLDGEPWVFEVDFGETLVPHRLTAVGRDAAGQPIAREDQWVNLPRPRAEVIGLLNPRAPGEPPTARILYQSVEGRQPTDLTVTFDGESLEVVDPRRIELPEYDPGTPHLLTVELAFEGGDTVRGDTLLGQGFETTGQQMTSLPVVSKQGLEEPPSPREMKGWVSLGDQPASALAFERGPAEVILVTDQDPGNLSRIRDLVRRTYAEPLFANRGLVPVGGARAEDRLRVLHPIPNPGKGSRGPELFPLIQDLEREIDGLFGFLTSPPEPEIKVSRRVRDQRLSDALAVAALTAASSHRPRAVLLLVGTDPVDGSRFTAETVTGYFRAMHVPLLVWSPFPGERPTPWGPARSISTPRRLFEALNDLRELLDRQAVLWVEGRHLPQRLSLSAEARTSLRPAEDLPRTAPAAESPPGSPRADVAPAPDSPRPPPDPSTSPLAQFAEVVEVDVVEVEVQVTGRTDGRVYDLTRDDFVLEVDGDPVPITQFRAPERPSGPPSPTPEPVREPFHMILYLDHPNLRNATRQRVLEGVGRFLSSGVPESARLLLVHQGPGLTVDAFDASEREALREALGDAVNRFSGRTPEDSQRQRLIQDLYQVVEAYEEASDPVSIQYAESLKRAYLSQLAIHGVQARRRLQDQLTALEGFLRGLGGLPGPKALLYVGDGLTLRPVEPLIQASLQWLPLDGSDQARLDRDLQGSGLTDRMKDLLREANLRGVTLYTLGDAGRDQAFAGVLTGSSAPGGHSAFSLQSLAESNLKEAGCLLADETGGLCGQAEQVDVLLTQAVEDVRSVYSLGFEPPHEADGEYHRIHVRLRDDQGLHLRHREGYGMRSRSERVRDRLLATLLTGVEANVHRLEVEVAEPEVVAAGQPEGDSGQGVVPVTLRFPVDSLVLLPDPQTGRHRLQARFLLAMRQDRGPAGPVHEIPLSLDLEPEQAAAQPAPLYSHEARLSLGPGRHWVAVALMDEIGRTTSFVRLPVTVPATNE